MSKPLKRSSKSTASAPAEVPAGTLWDRFKAVLARPVDGASLALFRIAVGLVMALEAWSLCRPNRSAISSGGSPLETYYTGPGITFHFPYEGFDWLPLFPREWIYVVVGIQAVAGIMMALGLFYRVSAVAVFLSWFYLWVVESTRTYWQSHYYLEVLLTFLLIWMPAANRFSLDARRRRDLPKTVPFWTLFVLRWQLVIAYFYAGVAKINLDWLLDAVPVRWFLREPFVTETYRKFFSPGGFDRFVAFIHSEGLAYFLSYTGLAFDLAVGFLLLARRTRIFGLVLMGIFHFTNHFLIFDNIGWFPLVGFLTALIFLDPDWPQRFWMWLRKPHLARPDWNWFGAGVVLIPVVGAALGWRLRPTRMISRPSPHYIGKWVAPFVVTWLVWQGLIPLRHYFIPGDGRFTYEGMSFSWRLKSEDRVASLHELRLEDPGIISRGAGEKTKINWAAWHGERKIYRTVKPGKIDWSLLPEIVVIAEPTLGERIIYNPMAPGAAQADADVRGRIASFWKTLYGRMPRDIQRAESAQSVLNALADGLRKGGERAEATALVEMAARFSSSASARAKASSLLADITARDPSGQVLAMLRGVSPFAFQGEPSPTPRFVVIDDPLLVDATNRTIRLAAWKNSPATRGSHDNFLENEGGDPFVICIGDYIEMALELPALAIFDPLTGAQPYIWWNSRKDLTASKAMHTSVQAFYLRRYARRVAELWQRENGRRPAVRAITSMSLNRRPAQELVDPTVDLASVEEVWFGHNPWIRDLQTKRIPREKLGRPEIAGTTTR